MAEHRLYVRHFRAGDLVVKDPEGWQFKPAFDRWWRGVGVGEVVESPFYLEPDTVDVRWPGGRYFCRTSELRLVGGPG